VRRRTLNGGGGGCAITTLGIDAAGKVYARNGDSVGVVPSAGGTMTVLFACILCNADDPFGVGMAVDAAGDLFLDGIQPPILVAEKP
jgi:hypothetical protein